MIQTMETLYEISHPTSEHPRRWSRHMAQMRQIFYLAIAKMECVDVNFVSVIGLAGCTSCRVLATVSCIRDRHRYCVCAVPTRCRHSLCDNIWLDSILWRHHFHQMRGLTRGAGGAGSSTAGWFQPRQGLPRVFLWSGDREATTSWPRHKRRRHYEVYLARLHA